MMNLSATETLQFDINADSTTYALYNLRTGKLIDNSDSASTNWDIGFNSTTIIFNSGSSGPGTAEAQIVETAYDQLMTAPGSGYNSDAPSNLAIPTGSGNGWYIYTGPPAFQIRPIEDRTIVVKTNSGTYAKVKILSYYEGNPALPNFSPPAEASRYYSFKFFHQDDFSDNLDASNEIRLVQDLNANGGLNTIAAYFNFGSCVNATAADSASSNWDFGFGTSGAPGAQFGTTTIWTNSGTSGPGSAQARFADTFSEPIDGYRQDDSQAAGLDQFAIPTGSGNGWYLYTGFTGIPPFTIIPNPDRNIFVLANDGNYYRVEILSYYRGNPVLGTDTPSAESRVFTFRYFNTGNLVSSTAVNACPTDVNGNGLTEINDYLEVLGEIGNDCD
ncbi:MAG: HmuY family protein [Bacteroidota bacterium]